MNNRWNMGAPQYTMGNTDYHGTSIQNRTFIKFGIAMLISFFGALIARYTGIMLGGLTTLILFIAIMLMNIFVGMKARTLNPSVAYLLLGGESLFMGVLLGGFVQGFSPVLVTTAFLSTTFLFLVLGIAGWTTKKDLSKFGPMLTIALIVIILVEIILLFVHVTMLVRIITAISVLVFAAFTAYDMQRVRRLYDDGSHGAENASTLMALGLYLDFTNLFVNLLQLMVGISRN